MKKIAAMTAIIALVSMPVLAAGQEDSPDRRLPLPPRLAASPGRAGR